MNKNIFSRFGWGSILFIFFSTILSWLLIHLMAIFGIFIVFAYPIWWLITPSGVPSIISNEAPDGSIGPYRMVRRAEGLSPTTFKSAILNALILLLITIFSAGFVYIESKILFKLGFPPTPKTVSFIIPPKGQYRLDEIFLIKIEISGIKVPINAVQADLGFDPQKLQIIDISTIDSFANIFIQKEINNEVGYTRLTGGLPSPGFFADHGIFGTIFFQGKTPGIVKVEFLPSSMVLANDSKGTNVLKDLASISYLILPERISEEEENLQKNISIQSSVLGEKTENTQMIFYEEEGVLGSAVGQEVQTEENLGALKFFLGGLEWINRIILLFWSKIFSLFKGFASFLL